MQGPCASVRFKIDLSLTDEAYCFLPQNKPFYWNLQGKGFAETVLMRHVSGHRVFVIFPPLERHSATYSIIHEASTSSGHLC